MAQQFTGKVDFLDSNGNVIFTFDPDSTFVQFVHKTSGGFQVAQLTNTGSFSLVGAGDDHGARLDGTIGALILGGGGKVGKIFLRDGNKNDIIFLNATTAELFVGAAGNEGDIVVRDGAGRNVLSLDGNSAALFVGTSGNEGDIIVRDGLGRDVFSFDGASAALRVGANGNEGDILVRNNAGAEVIQLNGETGDIILSNADAAENFDVAESAEATPGTLMVLDHEGKLESSSAPYDKKVVGVVAGAGDYRSGIVLDHKDGATGRVPISVLGKVSCKVDAAYGPIEVGDLLTTSPTPGHAMRASDPERAFGSVVGKVLSPLREGVGLANVLVNLQ